MTAQAQDSDHAFRRYALVLYGKPGIEAVLLELQDRHDIDVNLVLLCCWAGRYGVRLDMVGLAAAERAVAPWRETAIEPLRRLRRRLKDDVGGIAPSVSGPLRQQIKQVELAAEFLAQDRLYTMMAHLTGGDGRDADRAGLIRGNLLRYADGRSVSANQLPREKIEELIKAAVTCEAPLYPSEMGDC